MTEDMEKVTIKQTRGPTLEFFGLLLASDEWETRGRDPHRMTIQVWETRAGALVAVSRGEPIGREGVTDTRALVGEPMRGAAKVWEKSDGDTFEMEGDIDEAAMHFAVLDFFNWENRARSMARKQLGWSLTREIA